MTAPTSPTDLVIVGCGGHGRELYDVVRAINLGGLRWRVRGFVDDAPHHPERLERLGAELLGPVEVLTRYGTTYALGIGTGTTRRIIVDRLDDSDATAATVVHPGASIGSDVVFDTGVVVFDRCVITTNVRIGAHTHLNVGCVVQHDSRIGSFVQFSPGVYVNGDCTVADDVFLGTGAVVTRGCTVGEGARVGAGAVVLDDVEPGTTVVGAPARPVAPGVRTAPDHRA